MKIQCTFTSAELQCFQPSLEENTQFFVDASEHENGYWNSHAVQLEGSTLQEVKEPSHRENGRLLSYIFRNLVSEASPEDKDQVSHGAQLIFEANGWNPIDFNNKQTAPPYCYLQSEYTEPNLFFLKDAAQQEKKFWEEHSVYSNKYVCFNSLQSKESSIPHASRTAIQAIAKQILSSAEVSPATKMAVAKGVIAIFEGYEWKLEGVDVPVRWLDSEQPTEYLFSLPVLLKYPILCDEERQPSISPPRNVSSIDFQNFANYSSGKQSLESFSLREWAGMLNITHFLLVIDNKMIWTYLITYINSLEDVDAVFAVIDDANLPEEVAGCVLEAVLNISFEDQEMEAVCKDLKKLPYFAAVQHIPFLYYSTKSDESALLQKLFPNIQLK